MKEYPSIARASKVPAIKRHTFDKVDGSNIRFEWNPNKGWYKFGTRNQVIDLSAPVFGAAIPLFLSGMADEIEKVAIKEKWISMVCFAEYYGENSFAGMHVADDTMGLSLIDVAPYKKGILGPQEYLDLFGNLPIAKYLGEYFWDEDFRDAVWLNEIEGVTFEGVIGKAGNRHTLTMAKAKTQQWVKKVHDHFAPEEATKIIES